MTVAQTSLSAYHNVIAPTLGERQKEVLDSLRELKEATNAEIAGKCILPINCVTPRVNELRKLGLVEKAATRRCRRTGHTAIAWKVVGESYQQQLF